MKFLVGNGSNPAVVNGGPNPTVAQPLLAMGSGLVFSNPIPLGQGFAGPDQITIMCPFTIASNPSGSFFVQGSISAFGAPIPGNTTLMGPGPNDWATLPNMIQAIAPGMYNQSIGNSSLPIQPALFRMFYPVPGVLFLRVGYAPVANGAGDTFSVYCSAIAASSGSTL